MLDGSDACQEQLRSVSEQLRTLRTVQERLHLIVEGARDYAIISVDSSGTILSWSAGAELVFGWSAADAIGQPIAMTFTPEDRAAGQCEKELAQARVNGFAPDVRWHLRRDGSRVFIDGVTRLLLTADPEEVLFLKVGQDVTPRLLLEESLRDLNRSLEERVADRTRQIIATETERDALRVRLQQAEEDERRRIARELHDEAGQHLAALGLGLKSLSDIAPPGSEIDQRAAELRAIADTLGRELHALAVRLRPRVLDDFGLGPALNSYASEWSQRSGIAVDLHTPSDAARLPGAVESAIYRVVQEALTNVLRHAAATRVTIVVERHAGQLSLVVEDNGRGFDPSFTNDTATSGLGLRGIRERIALLRGSVDVESHAGRGTTIFVRVPLVEPPTGHHSTSATESSAREPHA